MITNLNTLDVIFLIIISTTVLLGVIRGFVKSVLSMAFLILGIIFALMYYNDFSSFFSIRNRNLSHFVSFITIFVVVIVIGSLITYLLRKLLVRGPLKSVDRLLGGVFGLIKGILYSSILVFALIVFPIDDNLLIESRLSPYFIKVVDLLFEVIPKDFSNKINYIKENDIKKNNRTI